MLDALAGGAVNGLFQLAGGMINNAFEAEQDTLNYNRQKEFAQNTLQWKAEDAKKAGFHPLAALGTNTANYTPSSSVGGGIGDALMNTGQALDRATRDALSQDRRLNLEVKQEQLKQERLKTASMEKSLANMGQAPQSTQATAGNLANSVRIAKNKPNAPVINKKVEVNPSYQILTHGKGFTFAPSKEMADATDAQIGLSTQNMFDRHTNPEYWWNVFKNANPPAPPSGHRWVITRSPLGGLNVEAYPENKGTLAPFSYDFNPPKKSKPKQTPKPKSYPTWQQHNLRF